MEKIIQNKLNAESSQLMTLLKSALSADAEEMDDGLFSEIISLFVDALSAEPKNKSADLLCELIVKNHWVRPTQLADVLRVLSTFPLKVLSKDEMLYLQPRLMHIIGDISNAYWREIFYTVHADELEEPIENLRADVKGEKEYLPAVQKPFIPSLIREFLETHKRLEDEIDEHKRAREALVDSEQRYRTLAESSHDYIFVINKNDQVEYLNRYAKRLMGRVHRDIIGKPRSILFDPQSGELQQKILQQVFETGKSVHRQDWMTLKSGTRIFLDTHLIPIDVNGNVRAILGISRNMTREKENEDKIVQSEKKYHSLFDAIHNPIFLIDAGKIADCNKSSTLVFEKNRDQILGQDFGSLIVPDPNDNAGRNLLHTHLEQCLNKGAVQHFELNYTHNDRTMNFEIHFSNFTQKKRPFVLAVIRNITPYKKANAAIRASEDRFRDIIRRSIDGYFFIDVTYRLVHLNRSAETILTYSREELNQFLFSKLNHEWNKKLQRLLKKAMGGAAFEWEEFHFVDKKKRDRWVAINLRRVYENGFVSGVEGFIKDITHLKNAQIELIENEARYRALFENTPYDVFGLTLERQFSKVNQNFQKNWGRPEGKMLHKFRPLSLAQLMNSLCEKVMDERKTQETQFSRTVKKILRHFRVILAPIITEQDEMIGFAGLIIDNTDVMNSLDEKRTFAERLIQTSEEEQRRISRDIHDSLGQILFALQLEISSAKNMLKKDAELAEQVLQNSEAKLTTCMKEASAICYRLSPQILADFGLVEALDDLVYHVQRTGNIKIEFEKKWLARKKDKSVEVALFRVSQEALANILKHSNARHVKIKLIEMDDRIELSIADNGDGFNLDSVYHGRKRGFGLINMKERIELLDGDFSITTKPEHGTTISINLPLQLEDTHE